MVQLPTIEEFAEYLMTEKDFSELNDEPEVLEQIKIDLIESIERALNSMILTSIPEDKLEELEKLTDDAERGRVDQTKMDKFIKANIPDLDNKVAEVLIEYARAYLMIDRH